MGFYLLSSITSATADQYRVGSRLISPRVLKTVTNSHKVQQPTALFPCVPLLSPSSPVPAVPFQLAPGRLAPELDKVQPHGPCCSSRPLEHGLGPRTPGSRWTLGSSFQGSTKDKCHLDILPRVRPSLPLFLLKKIKFHLTCQGYIPTSSLSSLRLRKDK